MARPKAVIGCKRDGFINYRVPPEMSNDLNALAFLLHASVGAVVRDALAEYITKYRAAIDAVEQARQAVTAAATPAPKE